MPRPLHTQNRFLASLPPSDLDLLRPHLKPIKLARGRVLAEAGAPVEHVYFPHNGLISLVVELAGGEMIEAAMVGRLDIVGGAPALTGAAALNKAIVQIAGTATAHHAAALRDVAEQSPTLRTALIRHEQLLFAQAQQAAACNAAHSIEARLARWLLRARNACGTDSLPLTQEILAQTLGVQRSSISLAAHNLQITGLIGQRRGRIQIANLKVLLFNRSSFLTMATRT